MMQLSPDMVEDAIEEPVHYAHFYDGYPLCWTYDQFGRHTSVDYEEGVTCEDCLSYLGDSL